MDQEIARLHAKKRLISLRQELAWLRDQASRGYPADENIRFESFKHQLALERSKSVHEPDVYTGRNQRALDDFFKQVALVFETKPLTYRLDKDKCVYAAGQLAGILSQEWNAEKRRISKDPTRTLSYDGFKAYLQERKFPADIQTANLTIKIRTLRQRNNQSVPELIAYLNKLENQIDPPLIDRERRDHLFVALNENIQRSVVGHIRPWSARFELGEWSNEI